MSETILVAPPAIDDFNRFVAQAQLAGFDWRRLTAERFSPAEPAETRFTTNTGRGGDEGQVLYRYDLKVEFLDGDGGRVAELELTGVLLFTYETPTAEPVLDFFGVTNGLAMAWPYMREATQSLASRLGLHGVILPVVTPTLVQSE